MVFRLSAKVFSQEGCLNLSISLNHVLPYVYRNIVCSMTSNSSPVFFFELHLNWEITLVSFLVNVLDNLKRHYMVWHCHCHRFYSFPLFDKYFDDHPFTKLCIISLRNQKFRFLVLKLSRIPKFNIIPPVMSISKSSFKFSLLDSFTLC